MRLLGTGRTADVYALDENRVLRRYRTGLTAAGEAAVMTHLAAAGYPVPPAEPGPLPTDLVMPRLQGPTMLAALLHGQMTARTAGETLAGLLEKLHALPARLAARPGDRILHLDLHPDNVLLTPDGPMVIDWTNSQEGPPGLDWAMSALILAQAATVLHAGEDLPPDGRADVPRTGEDLLPDGLRAGQDLPLDGPADMLRTGENLPPEGPADQENLAGEVRTLLTALTGAAGRERLEAWLPQAVERRAADPTMSALEVSCLEEAAALVLQTAPGDRP